MSHSKYKNRNVSRGLYKKRSTRLRYLFTTILVMAVVCFSIYFFLFRLDCQIDEYTISGLVNIKKEDVHTRIDSYLDNKNIFLVFSSRNFFLISLPDLEELLSNTFELDEVHIVKKYPKELTITVIEHIPTIIYSDGSAYVYVSPDGAVVKKLRLTSEDEWFKKNSSKDEKIQTTSSPTMTIDLDYNRDDSYFIPNINKIKEEFGDYPIIIWQNGGALRSEWIRQATNWHKEMISENMPISHIVMESMVGDARIMLQNQSFYILTNLEKTVDKQVSVIKSILRNKQGLQLGEISYIDTRFDGLVYWK